MLVCGPTGMMAVLGCVNTAVQKVNVFGFNWSKASYALHRMGAEEILAARLLQSFSAGVHSPPCAGKYSCDPLCDFSGYVALVYGESPDCRDKVGPIQT